MNNLLMQQPAPQPQPQAQAPSAMQFAPNEIDGARGHLGAVMEGLTSLAAKPKGALTKQDVFNSAADMIAQGAFSTPQAKQGLVAELAQMPDDETAIRQAIGGHLMRLAGARAQFHQQYGEG